MRNIKRMIKKIYILKEEQDKYGIGSFPFDDVAYMNLSEKSIADIKAHVKNNRVYFKDLAMETLIELAEV